MNGRKCHDLAEKKAISETKNRMSIHVLEGVRPSNAIQKSKKPEIPLPII
jgi:hypothetical protein